MKKSYIIGILIPIWLLTVAFPLVIAPVIAQVEIPVITDYPAPMSTYVFEKNFMVISLEDTMEINVPFKMPKGKPEGYNVTIDFEYLVRIDSEAKDRIVSVNYTFFSNENYLHWIREDFVGALKGTFGGSYPTKNIAKPETLNVGDNILKIKIIITTKAESPSKCHFHLEINNVYVKVKSLDLDGDGILDPVDLLPSLNNYAGLSALGIIEAIPISITGWRIHRKRR